MIFPQAAILHFGFEDDAILFDRPDLRRETFPGLFADKAGHDACPQQRQSLCPMTNVRLVAE